MLYFILLLSVKHHPKKEAQRKMEDMCDFL